MAYFTFIITLILKKKINLHTLGTLISYDLHIIFDLVKDLCKIYDKSM